jgi:hypothetical protein
MAENVWVIQDGRSILVEFDAAAIATAWGWFGNRSSGEGLEFATPTPAWIYHAWLRGGQYIMDAQPYIPPVGALFNRMLLGVGL